MPSTRWIQVVAFPQISADMAVPPDVPDGHGHTFHAADTLHLRSILAGEQRPG